MILGKLFPPKDLWSAAKKGDTKAIERLVSEGKNPNEKQQYYDEEGATPLHVAARHSQIEAIKLLVELGAKVDAKDNSGRTPLMEAIQDNENLEVLRLLLDLGAKIDLQDKCSNTALATAAFFGHAKSVEFLLERGAPISGKTGKTMASPIARATSGGNAKVVGQLISAKADVNAPGDFGRPPISIAAMNAQLDIVKLLVCAGANVSQEDDDGVTPLMLAVAGGEIQIVKLLLESGANCDSVGWLNRETALDIAESQKKTQIAEYLKGIGAKRAKDLPEPESKQKEELGTFWQLHDDSILSVVTDPWPPREGDAQLKVEVSEDDYGHSFTGTIEYQISTSKQEGTKWVRLFDGREDEEGNISFSDQIKLVKGMNMIQIRIQSKADKEFVYPESWKFEVK